MFKDNFNLGAQRAFEEAGYGERVDQGWQDLQAGQALVMYFDKYARSRHAGDLIAIFESFQKLPAYRGITIIQLTEDVVVTAKGEVYRVKDMRSDNQLMAIPQRDMLMRKYKMYQKKEVQCAEACKGCLIRCGCLIVVGGCAISCAIPAAILIAQQAAQYLR